MKCWQFLNNTYRIKQFAINIDLFSKKELKWVKYENVIIDTGFDGDILIPFEDFKNHGFEEALLKETEQFIAETISGEEIILRSALSEMKVNEKKIPIVVETFLENKDIIIGRGVLVNLRLLIDGYKEIICDLSQDKNYSS
ncbi:MAG: hypothetical protein K9W45_04340 [Candidatus Heimdallarchaeum aukensis]|uniref:Clan AA aspartic protease n=1 Tax=Candidatus Heimdallarchaeum aukensis TaxID=2876573 RepID=A0A9Y1FMK2_9ARCH|nr:MAG: hypothetical protein K9W45_04340 [Candidatus Heimdallarchaeum aukensis]